MFDKYYKSIKTKISNRYFAYSLKGNKVLCSICGWKGSRFLGQKCPQCGSISRTRLIPFALDYFKIGGSNLSVLHIAPNRIEIISIKSKIDYGRYETLDIVSRPFITMQKNIVTEFDEVERYDLVVGWHVLEHIPKDKIALQNIYNSLKSGGKALISVPIYPRENHITFEDPNIPKSEYFKQHGHPDHCRSCGFDYYKKFEEIGFATSELKMDKIESEVLDEYGLSKNHVVWMFSK